LNAAGFVRAGTGATATCGGAIPGARSLPHEALLWLAPYLASLAVILLIGI